MFDSFDCTSDIDSQKLLKTFDCEILTLHKK